MAINKKLITFATKEKFLGATGINNATKSTNGYYGNIPSASVVFIVDTGEIWTHGKYYSGGVWGTKTNNYVPFTVAGTTYNVSLDGHTHSQYLTQHQDLSAYLKAATAASTYVKKTGDMPSAAYDLIISPTSVTGSDYTDVGGGILIKGHTGTQFQLWLHDTSNVWYKKTSTGNWTKMDSGKADQLATSRNINGTSFNGTADITTAKWGTSRTITIGNTGKSVNGSADVSWSLSEIGASASSHNHDGRYVYNYANTDCKNASLGSSYMGMTTSSGIDSNWWHIINAGWNGEYRWNSQIGFPTQDRALMYFRSGKDDNSGWGAWKRLALYSEIPSSLKNPNSLIIQTNGTTLGSYDGSSAKTWDITYSNVGAAAASHNHTSLTGVTRINFNSEGSDTCYIGSTVSGSTTTLDFYLADDASQESFRWIFSDCCSGAGLKTIMQLYPTNNATTALKLYDSYVATQDWANSKYLPLSGGTLSGNLNFTGTPVIQWNDGTWHQRIYVTDDSTAGTAVFTFQQSSNSGSSWSSLFTIKDDGNATASTFTASDKDANYVLTSGGTKQWTTSKTANALVARDSNSYIYAAYINSDIGTEDSGTVSYIYYSYDNWIRKMSYSRLKNILNSDLKFGSYLPLSGGTMTGALHFANNTWNLVGDDVKIGDHNVGGGLGIIGANGNTRLDFCKYGDASVYKSITFDGTILYLDGKAASATTASNIYFSDDATLTLYAITSGQDSNYGTETVGIQSCFDGQNPTSSSYTTQYTNRCQIALQPRGGRVAIGTTNASYTLHVAGSIYATSWLRTYGSTGWYSETYGGGWYMSDSDWVRVYNNKGVYTANEIQANCFRANNNNGSYLLGSSNAKISYIDSAIIFNTGSSLRFGETAWDWNQWAGLKYSHSAKTIYFGIADGSVFTANNTQSDGILQLVNINTINTPTFLTFSGATKITSSAGLEIRSVIDGSDYATSEGYYTNAHNSIILRGDTTYGKSGILFTSSKGTTSINQTSDKGFIQFQPYGGANTSGESNKLVIGVGNDSDDMVYLQTPSSVGLKHVVGSTPYTIWDSNNDGSRSGLDADLLDGVHASELFTALSNSNKGVSITVGGTTKSISNINVDTVDGYHATTARTFDGTINWGTWNDLWSDGTNKHPWYGWDHRYPNTGVYSTTIADYYGLTLKTGSGYLVMTNGGNVGIGDVSPIYKLTVSGNVASTGFTIPGYGNDWFLVSGGGVKQVNTFFQYEGWKNQGDSFNLDDACGSIFSYRSHTNNPLPTWGVVTTFSSARDSQYRFQMAADGYSDGYLYYRCSSLDRQTAGMNKWTDWHRILDSTNVKQYAFTKGMIIIWSGSSSNIPSGWALCNGSNGTPNLSGRFVLGYAGSGTASSVGKTGGSESVTLTTSQMPTHNHDANHRHLTVINGDMSWSANAYNGWSIQWDHGDAGSDGGTGHIGYTSYPNNSSSGFSTGSTGGGLAHNNMPPYYVLCYIMYIGS